MSAVKIPDGVQALIPAFATLSLVWLGSCADGPETRAARQAAAGARLFQVSCAGCHGADARGIGPVAPYASWFDSSMIRMSNRGLPSFGSSRPARNRRWRSGKTCVRT